MDEFIYELFLKYKERRSHNLLDNENENLPKNLMEAYFSDPNHAPFDRIVDKFKKKYVYNENEVENVHNLLERQGLDVIYDYIERKGYLTCPNIYIILQLHILLYSKVPYPEFGGKFRDVSACISGSDVKTVEPEEISLEISKLYTVYNDLLLLGDEIVSNERVDLLVKYINMCIDLKCRIVEIHPFVDGNGRTSRALLNLLFRRVNLPPVYINLAEKNQYIKAMDDAIRLKDKSHIRTLYYYKICDSIVELDLNERQKDNFQKQYK